MSTLFLRLHSVCRDTNIFAFTVGRTVGICLIPGEYVRWLYNVYVLIGVWVWVSLSSSVFMDNQHDKVRTFRGTEVEDMSYFNNLDCQLIYPTKPGEYMYWTSSQTSLSVNFYWLLFKCMWFSDTEQSYTFLLKQLKYYPPN